MLIFKVFRFTFNHLTIEHSLIGESLFGKRLAEGVVDVAHVLPNGIIARLQRGLVADSSEKLLKTLALLLGEEGEILHALPCLEVDEELVGVDQILVEVVKVAEHKLAP